MYHTHTHHVTMALVPMPMHCIRTHAPDTASLGVHQHNPSKIGQFPWVTKREKFSASLQNRQQWRMTTLDPKLNLSCRFDVTIPNKASFSFLTRAIRSTQKWSSKIMIANDSSSLEHQSDTMQSLIGTAINSKHHPPFGRTVADTRMHAMHTYHTSTLYKYSIIHEQKHEGTQYSIALSIQRALESICPGSHSLVLVFSHYIADSVCHTVCHSWMCNVVEVQATFNPFECIAYIIIVSMRMWAPSFSSEHSHTFLSQCKSTWAVER